ncbi:MAG: hypothetical protein K0R14_12 [Burkholderiales bacterium]|jgi:hypothetical protein|nr:hypothetical protein [Burkholderiales bacterium]
MKNIKLAVILNLCIGMAMALPDSEFTKCDIYSISDGKVSAHLVATVAWLSYFDNGKRTVLSAPENNIPHYDPLGKIDSIELSNSAISKSQIFSMHLKRNVPNENDPLSNYGNLWSAFGNFAGTIINEQNHVANAKCSYTPFKSEDPDANNLVAKFKSEIEGLNVNMSKLLSEQKAPDLENNPGKLKFYVNIVTYGTNDLRNFVEDFLCPDQTNFCDNNKKNFATDFNFNLDQITKGDHMVAYSIKYITRGVKGEIRLVSGGVLIPQYVGTQIKGIILYFHGTSLAKDDVPSCFTGRRLYAEYAEYCHRDNVYSSSKLAGGILASQGYIVVMPDYIGLGADNTTIHPYVLYSKVNAASGLDMVTATKELLKRLGGKTKIQNNFYITGFSEGGAYALWASNIVTQPENTFLMSNQLNLKDTVGLSGAYDLKYAQMPMLTDDITLKSHYNIGNIDTAKEQIPVLISYLLSSYGFYDLNKDYSSLMQNEFLAHKCIIDSKSYTVPELFAIHEPYIYNYQIALSIINYLSKAADYQDHPAKAIVQSKLWADKAFLTKLEENSINSWSKAPTPIGLVYLSKDSVVTNLNSTNTFKHLVGKTGVTAKIIDTERYKYGNASNSNDFDHPQSEVLQLAAALQQFSYYK